MSAPKGWSVMGSGHARVLYPEGTLPMPITNLVTHRRWLGWSIAEWAVRLQRRMGAMYYSAYSRPPGFSTTPLEMVAWSYLVRWVAVDPDERFDAAMTISMILSPEDIIKSTEF